MKNSNYGYTPAEYKKFRLNAWVYLLLFSLLYCAHYCTRLNFSNAKVVMDRIERVFRTSYPRSKAYLDYRIYPLATE